MPETRSHNFKVTPFLAGILLCGLGLLAAARLLLWGDLDYVRRFAQSARLYDGGSFEVNEMLATWMLGEPHDAQTGSWSGTTPGVYVVPEWDVMCLVEALDTQGNGRIYPDLEMETS